MRIIYQSRNNMKFKSTEYVSPVTKVIAVRPKCLLCLSIVDDPLNNQENADEIREGEGEW